MFCRVLKCRKYLKYLEVVWEISTRGSFSKFMNMIIFQVLARVGEVLEVPCQRLQMCTIPFDS